MICHKIFGDFSNIFKGLSIKISFSLFKIGYLFSVKVKISSDQKSFVVYLFRCSASYIGETTRQLMQRIGEHLSLGKGSVIFDHLKRNPQCKELSIKPNLNST